MDSMKGEGKAILFFDRADGRVQLVSFADESWGIMSCGRMVCTWEADDLGDCLRTFLAMAGRSRGRSFDRTLFEPTACATGPATGPWDRAQFN